jgi:hypothetical protein
VIAALGIVIAAALVFNAVALRAARQLRPRLALWTLSVGAVVVAALSCVALAVVLATLVGQWGPVAELGDWSAKAIGRSTPFPPVLSIVCGVLLVGIVVSLMKTTVRGGAQLRASFSASRGSARSLVVLPDRDPYAYAVPGWPGRIVASKGLLESMDSTARRAVIAHEQAHLDQHHELHLFVASLAAATNPLLSRVRAAVRLACERAADERAVDAVGSRRAVAVAIIRISSPATSGLMLLSAGGSDVPARVRALLAERGAKGRMSMLVLVLAIIGGAAATLWLYNDLDRIFDMAARRS